MTPWLAVATSVAVLTYTAAAARDVGRGARWFVLGGIATSFGVNGAAALFREGSATLLFMILLSISVWSLVLGRGHPTHLMDLEERGIPNHKHQTALQFALMGLVLATCIPVAIAVGAID